MRIVVVDTSGWKLCTHRQAARRGVRLLCIGRLYDGEGSNGQKMLHALSPSLFSRNIRDASPIPCIFSSHFLLLFRQRGKVCQLLSQPPFDSNLRLIPVPTCSFLLPGNRQNPVFSPLLPTIQTQISVLSFKGLRMWSDSVSARSQRSSQMSDVQPLVSRRQ